jgi:hypothetical protein
MKIIGEIPPVFMLKLGPRVCFGPITWCCSPFGSGDEGENGSGEVLRISSMKIIGKIPPELGLRPDTESPVLPFNLELCASFGTGFAGFESGAGYGPCVEAWYETYR